MCAIVFQMSCCGAHFNLSGNYIYRLFTSSVDYICVHSVLNIIVIVLLGMFVMIGCDDDGV